MIAGCTESFLVDEAVEGPEPTSAAAVEQRAEQLAERLVTACDPLYSAEQRYAVFADLAAVELAKR